MALDAPAPDSGGAESELSQLMEKFVESAQEFGLIQPSATSIELGDAVLVWDSVPEDALAALLVEADEDPIHVNRVATSRGEVLSFVHREADSAPVSVLLLVDPRWVLVFTGKDELDVATLFGKVRAYMLGTYGAFPSHLEPDDTDR